MKYINKIFTMLAVASFALTACNDDSAESYNAGEKMPYGIYFANSASTINLSKDNSSFDVVVKREVTTDAQNVPLHISITNPELVSTTSEEIQFEAGADEAIVTFNYDGEKLGYDNTVDITISVDSIYGTPYGVSDYAFSVVIPAPWKSLGMGLYRDDYFTTFFGTENIEYEVEIEENEEVPGMYRLKNPYGKAFPYNEDGDYDAKNDYYMVINASDPEGVYIPLFHSGCDWSYGEFVMYSYAGYFMDRKGYTIDQCKEAGYCGTLKDGIITFPAKTLLVSMADYNDGGLYPANGNGMFRVVLPGVVLADYSVEVAYKGRFTDYETDEDYVMATANLGEDVDSVQVVLLEGANVADDVLATVLDGSYSGLVLSATASGASLAFPCTTTGTYNLVAISYGAGEAQEVATCKFKFTSSHDNAAKWNSLGMAQFTDDVFPCLFEGVDPSTWSVEVQEMEGTPGMLRLVDPYGANCPYNESEEDYVAGTFIEINACDPAGVYIERQTTGTNYGAEVELQSMGSYFLESGYDLESVKGAGYMGTFTDGVISFPEKGLLAYLDNDGPYYANIHSAFKLDLNAEQAAAIAPKYVRSRALNLNNAKRFDSKLFRYMAPMTSAVSFE